MVASTLLMNLVLENCALPSPEYLSFQCVLKGNPQSS